MKHELDEESRNALVLYRLNRAKDTMEEVSLLEENGYFNTAVTRLYYACFYAVEALLLKHRIQAQTHSGVKAMFGLHFVSTGKIPIHIGKTLSTLYEKRQSSDYEDFAFYDQQDVRDLKEKAVQLIDTIEKMI